MKFSTGFILGLFALLLGLGVFLHSLNQITAQASKEERAESFNSFNTDTYNLHNPEPTASCPNLLVNRGDVIFLYNMSLPQESQLVQTFRTMDEYQMYLMNQKSTGKDCPMLYLRQEVTAQGQDVFRAYSGPTLPASASAGTGAAVATPNVPYPEPMPVVTGGAQNFGQQGRPPMPPPFLETVPAWDLHHQPPLYVEGGLPALPMETRSPNAVPVMDAGKDTDPRFNQTGLNSYDPYGLYVGRFTDVDVLQKKTADTSSGLSANAADPNWGGVQYTQQMVYDKNFTGSEIRRAIYPQMGFV